MVNKTSWRRCHPLPIRAALAASCAFLPVLAGCPAPCQGPGCASIYNAALVGVLRGADQDATGQNDALNTWATLQGSSDQGPSWDVVLVPGALLVGIPDSSVVASLPLDAGGELAFSAEQGRISSSHPGDQLGAALTLLPDSAAGGIAELLVGVPLARATEDSVDDGAVLLFADQGRALSTQLSDQDATQRLVGSIAGGALGSVLAACGDVDGDGVNDWAAAAPLADGTAALAGQVVLARSTDLGSLSGDIDAGLIPTAWFGSDVGARAGSALDCRSDLSGDGLADLVVGVPFADGDGDARGAVHVLAGGPTMAVGGSSRLLADAALVSQQGSSDNDWLGRSVSTGDMDGDGIADLVAGAPGANGQRGEVWVWGSTGRGPDVSLANHRLSGLSAGDSFGYAVLIAALDSDELGDLLVAAPFHNPSDSSASTSFDSGALYQFSGSLGLSSWPLTFGPADATRSWINPQPYLRTGHRLNVGDFDSDGVQDLVLVHRSDPG